ncbi:MAG: Efflux pump membrane transporter BepE [Syntrophaceae bacterium PtaU1.Bin231]|nr:MAG: Efflux pump membrane transporter BepE [Syntrophaceae bacterium PtaU1.Bin231]
MKITALAVKRRIATAVIVIALTVLGFYGLWQLPTNFLPDMTYPLIKVYVYVRGATPEEIDVNMADPIERQMATVEGLDYLESSSIEGMYSLSVNFQYGVSIDTAYQDALAAMARVARKLPKDIDPPLVFKADPSQLPVIQITVSSDKWDLAKLRTWVDKWLQNQVISVQGVAGTDIAGGLKREIRVHLDPSALEKYGLTLQAVVKRLQEENIEQFGGRVTVGPREIIARTVGEFRSLDEIRAVVLKGSDAGKVYLRDVARVEDSHEEVRVITRLGGKDCVKLSVLKQADANTVEVARAVERKIRELDPILPSDVRLGIVENQADYVTAALTGVRNAALEAAVLIILVVYFFLGSWRQAAVMMLALPITLIVNFALMKLAGFSLNIFSLGGLVVAIGIVLDNSIVVIENITRLRHEQKAPSTEALALSGTEQVGPAIIAATLAFLTVFLPFLLVPGLISLLFRELILVIAGIVFISLAVAISATPMLTALLLGKDASGPHGSGAFERFFENVRGRYEILLKKALGHRKTVLAAFLSFTVVAALLFPMLGSEFLPAMDDGRILVKVKLPTGASVVETDRILRDLEGKLEKDPLIESYFTMAGGKVLGLYTFEVANEGEIDIQMVPRRDRKISTRDYIRNLRPVLSKVPVPGGNLIVAQMKMKGLRRIGEADVEVKIKGEDVKTLFDLARKTAETMNGLKVFRNVYVSMDLTKPEYQIRVDRVRAAALGVSVADISSTTQALLTGAVATRFKDGEDFYNIRLRLPEQNVTSRQDIENLVISRARGGYLRLRDVAQVVQATGPVEILREDQVKEVIVRGDASEVSVGQALDELRKAMATIELPGGYEVLYGGQAQMMAEMTRSVVMVLGFALFFAFAVLAVQFNSLLLPGLILAVIPFCLAGTAAALFLTGIPMGATLIIGILVIIALTINQGVLLVTFAESLRADEALPAGDAMVNAAKIRLRPVLMLSLCFIAGLIPLALNIEEGGDMLQPMAVGAIGGLAVGVSVTLLLLPVIYTAVAGRAGRRSITESLKGLWSKATALRRAP